MFELIRRRIIDRDITDSERGRLLAAYPNFLRNYWLGISNGVFFNTGMSYFNRTTIIPVFLSSLGAPSILISLTSLFEVIGWHLPQFFAPRFVVHKPQKMPLYRNAAFIRTSGLLVAV